MITATVTRYQNWPVWLQSIGGFHNNRNDSATGRAETYMKGCRRPHRERKLSLTWPITGSIRQSSSMAVITAAATMVAGRPTT